MNEKALEAKRKWRENPANKEKEKRYREANKPKWKSYEEYYFNRLAEENNNGQ